MRRRLLLLFVLVVSVVTLDAQVRLRLRHKADPPPPPPPGGSLYGPQQVACPGGSTFLSVGTNLQAVINGQPAGTTYCLQTGIHRMQSITPQNGDQYYGEYGAVLSGARVLTGWTQSGSTWFVTGQTQGTGKGIPIERCELPAYPRCDVSEDLWIDGVWLQHVNSLDSVNPTTWYFDYGTDTIYIGTNPAGRLVETSVTEYAFNGTAANVRIQNLVITRYATPSQYGAVTAENGANWTIQRNDIIHNHAYGVRTGSGVQVLNNRLNYQGQLGIGGPGTTILVDTNEIAFNNVNHYSAGWEAGGSKWALSRGLTARNNFVHHNFGPGLWDDIDNHDVLYENNVVEDNRSMGIFHEISWKATIRNNTIRRNGQSGDGWVWGAGIIIAGAGHPSDLSEVYGNIVEDNADGIALVQQDRGPWIVQNVLVRDNIVRMTGDGYTGAVRDGDPNNYNIYTTRNNRFENNTYFSNGTCNGRFTWADADHNFSTWQSTYGHDDTGSCTAY